MDTPFVSGTMNIVKKAIRAQKQPKIKKSPKPSLSWSTGTNCEMMMLQVTAEDISVRCCSKKVITKAVVAIVDVTHPKSQFVVVVMETPCSKRFQLIVEGSQLEQLLCNARCIPMAR
eukprot:SAG31_NODE_330_length_17593_cov_4.817891_22_plen_117_part_00